MKEKVMKPVSLAFAVCIAVSIFVGSGTVASAIGAGCTTYADGYHRYINHVGTGDGYSDYGTHAHLMGYDKNEEEVYQSCQWNAYYQYYVYKCPCGAVQPGSRKLEMDYMKHSVMP